MAKLIKFLYHINENVPGTIKEYKKYINSGILPTEDLEKLGYVEIIEEEPQPKFKLGDILITENKANIISVSSIWYDKENKKYWYNQLSESSLRKLTIEELNKFS